jgi:hypothetical protein
MPRPPVLGYLQSAVADNTAHSQMDKLLFEDEMSNIQPEWGTMREEQEVYDPAKAISEGDFMPVGAGVKLFRGVPKWYRGQMVKEGKYLSPEFSKSSLKVMGHNPNNPRGTWATTSKNKAKGFALSNVEGKEGQGVILEFDVPEEKFLEMSEPFRKFYTRNIKGKSTAPDDFYLGGIPKEYLKKVHKGYQEGGPAEPSKQWSQEDLLDLVNLGEQEYKDALTFWGRDTTLFDSLKQDIADTNIIVQELPETDKRLEPRAGGRYARGPYSKSPDLPFHPEGKANPEAVKDTIFVRGAMGSEKYPSESREEVLAHEFGHYFEPHYPGEKMLSWIKNPIDAFRYFARRHNPGLASYSGEQLKKHIKELEESGEFDDILRTPTSQITFNEMFFPVGTKYQLSKAKEKAEAMKEAGYKLPEGLQQGGPAERAPLLGYMNPAVQDETAHDSMDRLMFENELEQQPQHSMRTYQQGYDPAMEWGEGMMPIGGALRLLKGSKEWPDLLKVMAQTSRRNRDKMEVINNARNILGKKMDAGGADAATKQYLESKWMEQVIK